MIVPAPLRVKRRHSAKIPRTTTARNRAAVTLYGKHLVSAFVAPQKPVPQVLHLVFPRQLRERQQTKLDRQILTDLARSAQQRDS